MNISLTVPRRCLWTVFVSYALCWCVLCCRVYSVKPCGHLVGKGWPLGCCVCVVFCHFPKCVLVSIRIKGGGWRREAGLSPPVKYCTDSSKAVLLLWIFYVFLSCVCYAFVCVCLFVPCGHLLGKGWPLGSRLWCITVSLSLSHWYLRSGVVLNCIDSRSLHPYLL